MTPTGAKIFQTAVLSAAALLAPSFLPGCTNPSTSQPRRMTMGEQTLSRKVFAQEQEISILRDRIDAVAPGESARFGPAPFDDSVPEPPAAGPDYADIPRSGPRDLPEADLKKVIEKQDALIKALKARLKELENKKNGGAKNSVD